MITSNYLTRKFLAAISLILTLAVQTAWADNGIPSFKVTEIAKQSHTDKTAEYRVVFDSDIRENYTYEWSWTQNGKTTVSDQTTYSVDIPLYNRDFEVKVKVTEKNNSANTYTYTFTVSPKTYGVDLYADAYAVGSGDGSTKSKAILIENDLQLAKLQRDLKANNYYKRKYIKLIKDIDLSAAIWTPLGGNTDNTAFSGKFDGNKHTISGMRVIWQVKNSWDDFGLFAMVYGEKVDNLERYASVTNLIIDNALVEKKKSGDVNGDDKGVNVGVLAGQVNDYAEVSNIIVRNSIVTDNDETYAYTKGKLRVGGAIGNLDKPNSAKYRIYNIAANTKVNVLKNGKNSNKEYVRIGSVIGNSKATYNKNDLYIYPTNIYAYGDAVVTNFGANYIVGNAVGYIDDNLTKDNTQLQSTWYYANEATKTTTNYGTKKEANADNFQEFAKKCENFIVANNLDGSGMWASVSSSGFDFSKITLSGKASSHFEATASQGEGTYNWETSVDKQTWTPLVNADGTTVTSNPLSLHYKEAEQYLRATLTTASGTVSYTNVVTVPALRITKVRIVKNDNTYSIDIQTTIDNPDIKDMKVTYQWYMNNEPISGQTHSTYTGEVAERDALSCNVMIEYNGEKLYDESITNVTRTIYLCPGSDTVTASDGKLYNVTDETKGTLKANDDNDGLTPEKPKKTWRGAYAALLKEVGWDNNTIVLMGTSDANATQKFITDKNIHSATSNYDAWFLNVEESNMNRNVTITGEYNGISYNGEIVMPDSPYQRIELYGDTKFENLTFTHPSKDSYASMIFCQYNNLEMGKGLIMKNFNVASQGYGKIDDSDGSWTTSFQIFGGLNNDNRFAPLNSHEKIKQFGESMPHGKHGFSITIKSGFYANICVGGRQAADQLNGVMGTPDMPVKCTITLDIDRKWNKAHNVTNTLNKPSNYDCGIILAGNHEGAMFGDVNINIKSGKVGRIVNGTLGAQTETAAVAKIDGKDIIAPYNTFMGRATITLDPAASIHIDDDIDINERVIVTEMYGGSCGRAHNGTKEIINPFYGQGKIVINGGTFKYFGAKADQVFSGIYGAGAGGINGLDKETTDERIAYWSEEDEDKRIMLYGNYEKAVSTDNGKWLVHYKCYNADTHTYTDIDPQETKTEIIINGGVFGTKEEPIYGVYAGGSGYMTPGLWTTKDKTKPSKLSGNIYGTGTVASLTINGGIFYCKEGIFAGGRGTDYYFSKNGYGATDGDTKNYDKLAQICGDVELNINATAESVPVFHCDIFGGGYGVADAKSLADQQTYTLSEMAMIYGRSTVNINGGTFYGNIYGGGDMAQIYYVTKVGNATNLHIGDNALIYGDVFAGGDGRKASETKSPELVGRVTGNTSLYIKGTPGHAPSVYGDIFGGGNLAVVDGNTNINIYAGSLGGEIYGGGKGDLATTPVTSADVLGNTFVSLTEQGGQETDEDGKKTDNFSINIVWDKMWKWEDETLPAYQQTGSIISWKDNKEAFFKDMKFVNPHNIYGGGKDACKVGMYTAENDSETLNKGTGKTTVIIKKGMTPFSLLTTDEWKQTYNDNKNPHFYVFGGGYGKLTTVGETDVTINVEGEYGEYDAEIDDPGDILSKGDNKHLFKASAKGDIPDKVFDNSKGIPNFTVLGVLGGGYSGIVKSNAKVTVDGKTFLHRIYGGGFGDPESTEDNRTGQVMGNTEVHVSGANTYGDVFGGGAGVAPGSAEDIHFSSIARVLGTTSVEVSDDARIYGDVFGGGDIACVGPETYTADYTQKPSSWSELEDDGSFDYSAPDKYKHGGHTSYVNILGGDVFGAVYAGGKGRPYYKNNAQGSYVLYSKDYDKLGRINGNTLVHVANSAAVAQYSINETEENMPRIWGNIYGGCAYGTVDGNTLVHTEGGLFGGSIYGGGFGDVDINGEGSLYSKILGRKDNNKTATYANILGNTSVVVDGGAWIWNRDANTSGVITKWSDPDAKIVKNLSEFQNLVGKLEAARAEDKHEGIMNKLAELGVNTETDGFFNVRYNVFKKNCNIYGGGNRACNVGTYSADGSVSQNTGTANVEINHSPLMSLYETETDGSVRTYDMLDCTTQAGLCWYLCVNDIQQPQFSVFGAGFGVNTKVGNTVVYAQPGIKVDKEGKALLLTVNGKKTQYRYRNQTADRDSYQKFEGGMFEDFNDPKIVSPEEKIRYYGSTDGTYDAPETYLRYRISRLAWKLGAEALTFMDIHGGGFSGYVTGDTKVVADCQLACRNIFGGGLGYKPWLSETTSKRSLDEYDFGKVNNTMVFVKSGNVSLNVYGGGAGTEPIMYDGNTFYTDFPNMARANKTNVQIYGEKITNNNIELDRTLIMGGVYGGGDVANVGYKEAKPSQITHEGYKNTDYASTVCIRGGSVMAAVFGGGMGRTKAEASDYTKLGAIYGNGCIITDAATLAYPYIGEDGKEIDPTAHMAPAASGQKTYGMPILFSRIYGGCENGTVYGNTLLGISNGILGSNIFGGGYGDTVTVTRPDNTKEMSVTSADVTGCSNVIIYGGKAMLTSYWNADTRTWTPAYIDKNGRKYSPQYDHEMRKFKVNHNIYGGGNMASKIGNNSYVTMVKGIITSDIQVLSGRKDENFFKTDEWKEIYEKIGSPHFAVFGGGYGENTEVTKDTYVTVAMMGNAEEPGEYDPTNSHTHKVSGYTVMDMIGGGYNGKVCGDSHVYANGLFCRRILGGGFYNTVNNTNVKIAKIDCADVFGGGLMGDVLMSTNVQIGSDTDKALMASIPIPGHSSEEENTNDKIFIHNNVYGGNDVSGYVNIQNKLDEEFMDNGGSGTHINIYGGQIDGNVYGAGNGDYLYALDQKGNKKVTVNEHYERYPGDPKPVQLVYTVPMRENMISYKGASDALKIVNINTWRPLTNKVSINIKGRSSEDMVKIKGDVYGGGNSATVINVNNNPAANKSPEYDRNGFVRLNIGSNVNIGRVFMGSNGDALFAKSEDNAYLTDFCKLNGDLDNPDKELNLANAIEWDTEKNPGNKISELYIPTKEEQRPLVYPHLLDLYFMPVEMNIQGELFWNGTMTDDGKFTDNMDGLENCTIGTFCCGSNRGNMNIYSKKAEDFAEGEEKKIGNVFEYTFPAGLTITDKIIGGCNNANYTLLAGKEKIFHEGGYLLGTAKSEYPYIKLNIKNKFEPKEKNGAYTGGNVYGGCYESGTIRGDITVNLQSDMLAGKDKAKLDKSNDLVATSNEYAALNVFGAGYGMTSYVYGNSNVKIAEGNKDCIDPSIDNDGKFKPSGTSANFVYGGGQQGNLIGVTNVEMFNGHIYKSLTGGSYSGYVWGSTVAKVGFPQYYEVNFPYTGRFLLKRTDKANQYIDRVGNEESGAVRTDLASETIKQSIFLVTGDIVSKAVFEDIYAINNSELNADGKIDPTKTVLLRNEDGTLTEEGKKYFTLHGAGDETAHLKKHSFDSWDNIHIKVGEAIYGGGYSLAEGGGSVMANEKTVRKYDEKYNLDKAFDTNDDHRKELASLPGGTTAGFGGNTTILVTDQVKDEPGENDRNHITVSHQEMTKVTNLAEGSDLFGYYYKDVEGKYHYIHEPDKYYKGKTYMPENAAPNTDIYKYDNEGGIFGDGHLSYTAGFRSADIIGYGFTENTVSNPKIINTFQRMDILRLEDNCFSLLGARDYATNTTDMTPYSISRVSEIKMVANKVKTGTADTQTQAEGGNQTPGAGTKLLGTTERHARNYMGLANSIHYVGAISSNVSFSDDAWYDAEGNIGDGKTYMQNKQNHIDRYYGNDEKKDLALFQQRNSGTAKNMIGIASGYALKIQNVQEVIGNDGKIEEVPYWGPIYGVVEMNLIDIREDEGGGYVYADNVHERSDFHNVDYLETTGNFVFPYDHKEGRFIVDDCFSQGYDKAHDEQGNPTDKAHYWYVTGFNYHYAAHITGYTYDSDNKEPFYSSKDGLMVFTGLKGGQKVEIHSWNVHNAHTEGYTSDLEVRNYDAEAEDAGKVKKGDKEWYTLYVGASENDTYDGKGFKAKLPMKTDVHATDVKEITATLPTKLNGDAKISFKLEDKVNNSTSEYYDSHLKEPVKATLVLTAPAKLEDGSELIGMVKVSKFYTKNGDAYNEVTSGTLDANTTYYYRSGETSIFRKINNDKLYERRGDGKDHEINIADIAVGESAKGKTYYCEVPRHYTYTIDLTIEYALGPNINGNIKVYNCALPGERIRVDKGTVKTGADQSFLPTGFYWRIGKREKDENGKWRFVDNTEWSASSPAPGYDTYRQGSDETPGAFDGCYYDDTQNYLEIPAYYYMNGYGIQLGITMTKFPSIFPVEMTDDDQLVVHNYHQMDPHQENVNLRLAEALTRAKAEPKTFAQPRIYLYDSKDLEAFKAFIDSVGTKQTIKFMERNMEKEGKPWEIKDCEVPRHGEYGQFVLQDDIDLTRAKGFNKQEGKSGSQFKGIIHGNGHIIYGLDQTKSLFNVNSGKIYNLGLANGNISDKNNGTYYCSFEYNPNTADGKAQPVVYRLDGTDDRSYSAEDFRLGKVAYDLNQYYLEARYNKLAPAGSRNIADKYVELYFKNGDYQYAWRKDAITGSNSGITYLRTGTKDNTPNYGQSETRHDKAHAKDLPRLTADGTYLPLFNEPKHLDSDETAGLTESMNDYLFWGQSLQSTPDLYPSAIVSRQTSMMANRVYRTAGYYGTSDISTFHYNAYDKGSDNNMATFVNSSATTAIDFTCHSDKEASKGLKDGIFYPPIADNATSFYNLIVSSKANITGNLLVYTPADNTSVTGEAYDVAEKTLTYREDDRESTIKGHLVSYDADKKKFVAKFLHLVERTPDNKDSNGETCTNNDFCVPIPFSVTDRAWYTRKPMYYTTNGNGAENNGWEGICLPFTVQNTEASLNGEITHFYGTAPANTPAAENHWNLHHEYWLRGAVSIDQKEGKPAEATFKRPGAEGSEASLFVPKDNDGKTLCEGVSYTFNNSFFVDTYGNYNSAANTYYNKEHEWTDYLPLTSGVPYIVSFPGETYREFDLSSKFYAERTGKKVSAQTITFSAEGTNRKNGKDVNIPVTATMATSISGSSFAHAGTFTAKDVKEGAIYGMNDKGTAFDDASAFTTVMPFRTYMAPSANTAATKSSRQLAPLPSVILITETTGIDSITPDNEGQEAEEQPDGNYVKVSPVGKQRIRVESTYATTLSIFTTTGQLYRLLDVRPGTATYSGFQPGLYIAGKAKIRVQ